MWCPLRTVCPLSPLWLLVALALHAVSPQLFDVRVPLVYEDPLRLSARRPTYFGYSVLLYSRNNYTWLQVGAPRSNCSSMQGITEPGRVYRCNPGKQCQLVLLDKTKNDDEGGYWDRKDGSWLGATMAIHPKADKMVVCAPRWKNQVRGFNKNLDWLIHGACYTTLASDPDLLSASADKLIPLISTAHRTYTQENWGTKFVYDYAMGQAGISAYFTHERHDALEVDKLDKGGKGGQAEKLQLVLGAPGVHNWRGSSVLLTNRLLPSFVNRKKRDLFRDDGSFDSGVIPKMDIKSARDGDYMGYSGVCGHFFSKGELLHVAGAPRGDNYMGKVYLYEFPARTRNLPKERQSLRGDSAGSYFGAALGAADITGDGLDDLLVGAPYGRRPKVHVFPGNKLGALGSPATGAKFLLMPQWGRFSRFGISIATADINQDGYSDVLVGAPEAEDGCGGVAIYLGSKTGLREKPHQEILAKTIAPGLGMRGFGISIAPPVDIDANSLPDVAIGAYLSGHVVLLRARARAQLTATLIAVERLQRESKSLKINACMLYSHKLQATQTIKVSRVLTVDSAFGRAYMNGTQPTTTQSFKYNRIRDLTADKEFCEIIDLVIKPDVQNFQDPLEITLNVTLLESQEPNNPVIITAKGVTGMDTFNRMTPVIESGQGTARLNLPFSTNCGDDNICSSKLVVNAHFPDHSKEGFVLGSTGSIVFEISLENRGEPAYVAQVMVKLKAPASLARLPPQCRADPEIICNMGNPLLLGAPPKILRLEIDMRGVSDTSRAGEKIEFIVEALTESDNKEKNPVTVPLVFKVDARVGIAGKSLQDTYSYSQLENSTSMGLVHFKHLYEVQKFGLSPVAEAELIVHLPYKYQYKGAEITFVKIYQPEGSQAGQPFNCQNMDNYTYAIDTDQQITAHEENYEEHSSSSNIDNSTGINNSSGIDNTMKIKIKRSIRKLNTADYFIPLVDTVNSDELQSAVESHARVKREAQSEVSLPANRTVRLSCAEPGVSCHTIRCVVGPFRRQQHVTKLLVTMALNITALKDTMGMKDILVLGSDGLVTILGEEVSEGSQAKVRSVFVSSPPEAQVELWIIAFSIILGMLLLLIVAMGLVKAGFFERKKKEELQALKEAEATQDAAETEEVWTEEHQKEEEDDFKVEER